MLGFDILKATSQYAGMGMWREDEESISLQEDKRVKKREFWRVLCVKERSVRMKRKVILVKPFLSFLTCMCICSVSASAAELTLSTHSSNPHGSPGGDPGLFDATLTFSVVDSTLTLTVSNDTTGEEPEEASKAKPDKPDKPPKPGDGGAYEFKINQIYFNVTNSNITDLTLDLVNGSDPGNRKGRWDVSYGQDSDELNAAGFGYFDVKLPDLPGNPRDPIPPSTVYTFTIGIIGTGPYSDTDFIGLTTIGDPGFIPMYAAGKFFDGGTPVISGFGGTNVPEPAMIGLLGLGGLCLLRRRRRT
jgi:hypothetical protein